MLAALKAGDEATFAALVDEHTPLMLRLAHAVCSDAFRCRGSRARGLDRLHRGLGTIRGEMLAEDLAAPDRRRTRLVDEANASVAASRSRPSGTIRSLEPSTTWPRTRGASPVWAGGSPFLSPPGPGRRRRDAREARDGDRLPPRSPTGCDRAAGCRRWSASEVCMTLGMTDANQRVLLHRARRQHAGAHSSHISSSLILELSGGVPRRCNQKNRKETVNRC